MTPKEKAKELLNKFARIDGYQDSIDLSKCEYEKQCALITIDEISKHCYEVMKQFWEEVKQEI
jgi:hypothetical protein